MQYKFLFTVILLFPSLNSRLIPHLHSVTLTKNNESLLLNSFTRLKKSQNNFWESGKKLISSYDTTSLKSSNWYADVMKAIEEKEYEINYLEQDKCYSSPNRKQNLRSFYTSDKFTLSPRNDSEDKWKLTLKLNGIYAEGKRLYGPSDHPDVEQKGNCIRFDNLGQFTTEYINSKEGVRQNFIINQQPVGNPKKLSIRLEANESWFINLGNSKEIHFAKVYAERIENKLIYNDLKVWDADNKELDASFNITKNIISISVTTENAVYPITIDPLSTTPVAMLEENQGNAHFGCSVSSVGDVNGDGYSDIIVGANLYDDGEADEGAAFLFHGSISGINSTFAAIIESNQIGANFGISVASAGDVNNDGYSDIIVGAYLYDNGQIDEGAAFVYHGSVSGINTTPAIRLESNQFDAQVGISVASAGDVNNDGYSDIVIGGKFYDNGQTDEGAAFIYHGSVSGINSVIMTFLESNQANSFMGFSVACAGDVNGDGYSDVIVGAYSYSNGQNDEGVAFIYHGSTSGINPLAATIVESNHPDDNMGSSVASAGDINGDGYSDIIVSDTGYSNGESYEGAAYIFYGSATGIITTPATIVESNQINALMGYSVACGGDINGDGYSDILVGVENYENGENYEGAVFVYLGSNTGINTIPSSLLESNQANSHLGYSVASAGDINGDGYSDLIVGAYLFDNGQIDEGAAFVYHGSASGINTTSATIVESNQPDARMGVSVACSGDVNSDGYSDIIVGADFFDNGQNNEGAAFIFHGSITGINPVAAAVVESNQANAQMGWSVSEAGDVNGDGYSDVIVGAYLFNGGGAAFIYHGSATGINIVPAAIIGGGLGGRFGFSVSGAGDVNGDGFSDIIVGAPIFNNGQSGEGAAFVYHGSASGISSSYSTLLESNQVNAYLGWSVSSAGDVNGDGFSDVIVGAYTFNNGQIEEGAAFVYHGSASGISSSYSTLLESNQANAWFGYSVAIGGDVNGDGYCDVLVGAPTYDNGQADEGVTFVYHGSATGINSIAVIMLESNQSSAYFGRSVSSAGDVNGDGYSDIILGAYGYDNGQSDEGIALIFHGSNTGINSIAESLMESNQTSAYLGWSVSCAGDVNGDGYSDVIVGAHNFENGQIYEGAAFVYLGNNGDGLRNNLRLYNTDLVTPIQRSNYLDPNLFGAGLYSKSPIGRVKAKMVWEVKAKGAAFSGNPITNSTVFYDKQPSFTDLSVIGTELKYNIQKQGMQTKVRTRVEYDKVTAITGQIYGPWRYPPGYTRGAYGMNSIPLPVTLINFNGQLINSSDIQLNWITSNEINMGLFNIERSTDRINFIKVGEVLAKGQGSILTEYSFIDINVNADLLYYRLKSKAKNGDTSYTKTITLKRKGSTQGYIFPNPVLAGTDAMLILQSFENNNQIEIRTINMQGQILKKSSEILQLGKNELQLSTKGLNTGVYSISVFCNGHISNYRLIIQ